MPRFVLDTHTLVWFYSKPEALSPAAQDALFPAEKEPNGFAVSAITFVEIIYLVEKGRLSRNLLNNLWAVLETPDSPIAIVPVREAIVRTMETVPRDQVPEMPDRIIAATALSLNLPLVTRDLRIRASNVRTIW